jgi:hypothetical protein
MQENKVVIKNKIRLVRNNSSRIVNMMPPKPTGYQPHLSFPNLSNRHYDNRFQSLLHEDRGFSMWIDFEGNDSSEA